MWEVFAIWVNNRHQFEVRNIETDVRAAIYLYYESAQCHADLLNKRHKKN